MKVKEREICMSLKNKGEPPLTGETQPERAATIAGGKVRNISTGMNKWTANVFLRYLVFTGLRDASLGDTAVHSEDSTVSHKDQLIRRFWRTEPRKGWVKSLPEDAAASSSTGTIRLADLSNKTPWQTNLSPSKMSSLKACWPSDIMGPVRLM